MKELRINYHDIINIKDSVMAEFIFKQALRRNGFNLSKPIIVQEDQKNFQTVYQQEDD